MSDNKALLLQTVSTTIKRLVKKQRSDVPRWTEAFEKTLSKLSNKDLDHLEYLLNMLELDDGTTDRPKRTVLDTDEDGNTVWRQEP